MKVSESSSGGTVVEDNGVVTSWKINNKTDFTEPFVKAKVKYRHWNRDEKMEIPA